MLVLYFDLDEYKNAAFHGLITKTHFGLVPPVCGSALQLFYPGHSRDKVLF